MGIPSAALWAERSPALRGILLNRTQVSLYTALNDHTIGQRPICLAPLALPLRARSLDRSGHGPSGAVRLPGCRCLAARGQPPCPAAPRRAQGRVHAARAGPCARLLPAARSRRLPGLHRLLPPVRCRRGIALERSLPVASLLELHGRDEFYASEYYNDFMNVWECNHSVGLVTPMDASRGTLTSGCCATPTRTRPSTPARGRNVLPPPGFPGRGADPSSTIRRPRAPGSCAGREWEAVASV